MLALHKRHMTNFRTGFFFILSVKLSNCRETLSRCSFPFQVCDFRARLPQNFRSQFFSAAFSYSRHVHKHKEWMSDKACGSSRSLWTETSRCFLIQRNLITWSRLVPRHSERIPTTILWLFDFSLWREWSCSPRIGVFWNLFLFWGACEWVESL